MESTEHRQARLEIVIAIYLTPAHVCERSVLILGGWEDFYGRERSSNCSGLCSGVLVAQIIVEDDGSIRNFWAFSSALRPE